MRRIWFCWCIFLSLWCYFYILNWQKHAVMVSRLTITVRMMGNNHISSSLELGTTSVVRWIVRCPLIRCYTKQHLFFIFKAEEERLFLNLKMTSALKMNFSEFYSTSALILTHSTIQINGSYFLKLTCPALIFSNRQVEESPSANE
jgi:hypothetical protein